MQITTTGNMITDPDPLAILCVSGIDAKKFLQGQLTCNLDEITQTHSSLGAHCNPQGRVISLFNISLSESSYHLQMPLSMIPIAAKNLQKYAVFFKVNLSTLEDDFLKTLTTAEKALEIEQGIPTIYPETSEKFLPHDLNLPALNAVSFTKGCYTGQEIIARMQYRGKIKNHLYRARLTTVVALKPGDDVFCNNQISGTIVDFCKVGYNSYDVLVLTSETLVGTSPLFIDPANTERLEFLD